MPDHPNTPLPFVEPFFVPEALLVLPQWVCWRPDKKPICVATGKSEKYTDIESGRSFDEAVEAVTRWQVTGVGFVFQTKNRIVGIDLDKCRNPETGEIEPWAQAILDMAETYAEVSPSGRGLHLFAIGDLDGATALKHNPAQVEMYTWGRYFTFTGNHVQGTPWDVLPAPRTLAALKARIAAEKAARPTAEHVTGNGEDQDGFALWAYKRSFFGRVNDHAMKETGNWVPVLFPSARREATGAWRVKSQDLGRGLQEDLSIHPAGIKDWGVNDMGDAREGKRSPIDLVIEWWELEGGWTEPPGPAEAALWLCRTMGVDPRGLGWRSPLGEGGGDDESSEDTEDGELQPKPKQLTIWQRWFLALDRLRRAAGRPDFVNGGWIEDKAKRKLRFDPGHSGPVPVRPEITDRHQRGTVSMVAAPPNAGKSTLLSSTALAIVCEKASILGQTRIDWCGDVLIISNEETKDLIFARWKGQARAHGLVAADFKHDMLVWPDKGFRLGRLEGPEALVPTEAGVAFVERLATWAEEGRPVAFIGMDTLVSLFEGINENSSGHMDKALGMANAVAEAGFLAVDIMHHTGKAAAAETSTSYRGSSAIGGAIGEMSTLVPLPADDAESFGIAPNRAKNIIRVVGQKQRDGELAGTWYFERERVSLMAQDPRTPDVLASRGVAAIKPIPAPVLAGVNPNAAHQILVQADLRGRKLRRGGRKGRSHVDQAARVIDDILNCGHAAAEVAVATLLAEGRLVERREEDAKGRRVVFVVPIGVVEAALEAPEDVPE